MEWNGMFRHLCGWNGEDGQCAPQRAHVHLNKLCSPSLSQSFHCSLSLPSFPVLSFSLSSCHSCLMKIRELIKNLHCYFQLLSTSRQIHSKNQYIINKNKTVIGNKINDRVHIQSWMCILEFLVAICKENIQFCIKNPNFMWKKAIILHRKMQNLEKTQFPWFFSR